MENKKFEQLKNLKVSKRQPGFEVARWLPQSRVFIGQDKVIDSSVIENGSGIGVVLTDPGDRTIVRDSASGVLLSVEFVKLDQGKIYEVNITKIKPDDHASQDFEPIRIQTNQAVGVSVSRDDAGEIRPNIIRIDSQKDVEIFADPNIIEDELWRSIEVVISPTTTMSANLLSERQARVETGSEPIGSQRIYEIVSSITNPPLSETGKNYKILREASLLMSKKIPEIVEAKSLELIGSLGLNAQKIASNETKVKLSSSKGLLDENGMQDILLHLSLLPKESESYARYFLQDLLPSIICFSGINTTGKSPENDRNAYLTAIKRLINIPNMEKVDFFSIFCPPYNYVVKGAKLDKYAQLIHQNGQLLPTFGDDYDNSAKVTAHLLSGIAKNSPSTKVNYTAIAYSGELGLEGLVEVGQDVLDHYKGNEDELTGRLNSAFTQLKEKTEQAFGETGVEISVLSLEETFVKLANPIVDDFTQRFSHVYNLRGDPEEIREIDSWLKENLDLDINWLKFYYNEEDAYGEKQHVGKQYNVLVSAFREGILYYLAQIIAARSNSILWGLETTDNYMVRSIPLVTPSVGQVGVIMANAFNPAQPLGFGIRQPYNRPSYDIQNK